MQNQKFSVSESWSVMLIFLDQAWIDIEKKFSRGYKTEHVFMAMLQMDHEFYQEWLTCCKKYFGEDVSLELTLSREQIRKLVFLYISYYDSTLGTPLPVLLKYLDGTLDVKHLWEQAFDRVQGGERWRREDESPELEKFLGTLGGRKEVTPNEGATITGRFLTFLCGHLCETQPQIAERINRFISITEGGDPGSDGAWKEYSIRVCRRSFNREKMFSLEEIFAITIIFVVQYSYMYGFQLYEVLPLLHDMRINPSLHAKDWGVWQKALDLTLTKGYRNYID